MILSRAPFTISQVNGTRLRRSQNRMGQQCNLNEPKARSQERILRPLIEPFSSNNLMESINAGKASCHASMSTGRRSGMNLICPCRFLFEARRLNSVKLLPLFRRCLGIVVMIVCPLLCFRNAIGNPMLNSEAAPPMEPASEKAGTLPSTGTRCNCCRLSLAWRVAKKHDAKCRGFPLLSLSLSLCPPVCRTNARL